MGDQQLSLAKPRRSLRTRLWRAGGLVGVFVLTFFIGNFFIPRDKAVTRQMLGHDFLAFYYGGTCARTGQLDKLYDLDSTRQFEARTGAAAGLELGPGFGPWWNPPFAAWMFAPLSALPYHNALVVWWSIGFACLAISILLMCRMLSGGWKTWLLVPLLIVTVIPFFQVFSHGQNTFVSLLLLCIVVTLWRSGQSLLAGLVCGLLFYKPQLGAVIAIVLCLSQGRRAVLGVALTGTVLVLVNVLTMPGTIHEFLFHMPQNLHWMQEENHYRWERHVTFKGFWRLTFQGWASGPTAPIVYVFWGICELALLAGMAAVAWRTLRGPRDASSTDRLIAAAIAAMPLLMPFYFDYDLLLISVAVVLYAVDYQRYSQHFPEDRWLIRTWMCLFVVLEFGTVLAGHTRVHPIVPLVSVAAALLIRRALRPQPRAAEMTPFQGIPSAVAAAA
jgi:hypothetical protein